MGAPSLHVAVGQGAVPPDREPGRGAPGAGVVVDDGSAGHRAATLFRTHTPPWEHMFDSWVECPGEQVAVTRERSPLIRRSRQAAGLARAFSERTGRPVDLTYDGSGTGSGSGWRVSWVDGPTTVQMRALVAEHTPIHAPDLPAEDLGFERGDTDLGVAVI